MKPKISKTLVEAWIDRFHHRAEVMREILSGSAERSRKMDRKHTLAVVVVGAFLTFIAFSGTERLSDAGVRLWARLPYTASLPVTGAPSAITHADPGKLPVTGAPSAITHADPGKLGWFEFFFNLSALSLFVLSIVNLIYRWKEEHQEMFQGVKRLTQYMHWLDELRLRLEDEVDAWVAKEVRMKYQIIVEQLPPSNEADYIAAKLRLKRKGELAAGAK